MAEVAIKALDDVECTCVGIEAPQPGRPHTKKKVGKLYCQHNITILTKCLSFNF